MVVCQIRFWRTQSAKKNGKSEFGIGIGSDIYDLDVILDKNYKIVPYKKVWD